MLKKVNHYLSVSLFLSILFFLVGLIFLFFPKLSFETLSVIFTFLFFLNGFLLLWVDYQNRFFWFDTFAYGVLSLIFGVLFLLHPLAYQTLIPFIVGIWFLISAFVQFRFSLFFPKKSLFYFSYSIFQFLFLMMCGVYILMRPLESLDILTRTLGILLMVTSLSYGMNLLFLKKYIHSLGDSLDECFSKFKLL